MKLFYTLNKYPTNVSKCLAIAPRTPMLKFYSSTIQLMDKAYYFVEFDGKYEMWQVFKVGEVDDKRSKAYQLDTLKSSFLEQQGKQKGDDSSKKEL